jgi:hypothetical protein
MTMIWFLPIGLVIGLAGTQTSLKARHFAKNNRAERAWWLLLVLAWLPTLCWIAAQFVLQD